MSHLLNDAAALRSAWDRLNAEHPHMHGPQAAAHLGVPEAAMIASRFGHGTTLLRPDLRALLCGLAAPVSSWGKVLVAVRTDIGVSLAVQNLDSAVPEGEAIRLYGAGYSALLSNQGIATLYLFENNDAHGHTVSLNWFDGAGDVVGRLFLMAKSRRELVLPHLESLALPAPEGEFWRPESLRVPAVSINQLVQVTGLVAYAKDAAKLFVRAVLACADAGVMQVNMQGLGAYQSYVGPLAKTSEAGGGVHASDAGCKLHLQPRLVSSVWGCKWLHPDGSVSEGLRFCDARGGALDLAPVSDGKKLGFKGESMRRVFKRRTSLILLVTGWLMTGLTAHAAPERWIVANSYVAEIVVALGSGSQIVAVGGGADHLAELRGVPRLPGFRQVSAEPMLALSPQRVLISNEWTVPQTLDQLRAAGVQVEVLDADQTPEGVEKRIRLVAKLLGKVSQGEALVAKFKRDLAEALALAAKAKPKLRALFILAGGNRPTLVGGKGSNVAALLDMAGAINVAQGIEGFKVMSAESMIEAAPDVILTNQDGTIPNDGIPVALRAPGAMATPAGKAGRLITIPGQYLQGMGILTPEGVTALVRKMHPQLP